MEVRKWSLLIPESRRLEETRESDVWISESDGLVASFNVFPSS